MPRMTCYRQVTANQPGRRSHVPLHLGHWLLAAEQVQPYCNKATDGRLLQQVMERGMHSGEGLHGCSIYTGTGGVAYMFLRLAEALQHSQSLIAQHPQQPLSKLTPECLLRRADEYGHWAKHLSHCSRTTKVPLQLNLGFYLATLLQSVQESRLLASAVASNVFGIAEARRNLKEALAPLESQDQCMISG